MKPKPKLSPAINKDSLAPIGKVVVNFAALEGTLDFAIWLLLVGNSSSEQRTGQIVTAELMFKNKIALFSSLYQHRFQEKSPFDELKQIRKRLNDAKIKRNDLIHSAWLADGRKFSTSAKEKQGIKINSEKIDASQIDKIANFIAEVGAEMMGFHFKLIKLSNEK